MSYIETHCKDVKCLIGVKDGCETVHMFLDQYAPIFPVAFFDDYHRTFLHNTYGIRICESRWGKNGFLAAIIHLTRDYCGSHMDGYSLEKILEEFPRYLMWFDLLITNYKPDTRIIRGWNKQGLVSIAFPED